MATEAAWQQYFRYGHGKKQKGEDKRLGICAPSCPQECKHRIETYGKNGKQVSRCRMYRGSTRPDKEKPVRQLHDRYGGCWFLRDLDAMVMAEYERQERVL